MKKYFLILLLVAGCKGKKPENKITLPQTQAIQFPRFVSDKCTGKWAVQLTLEREQKIYYRGLQDSIYFDTTYYYLGYGDVYPPHLNIYGSGPIKDTGAVSIPHEFNYQDSAHAIDGYKIFIQQGERKLRERQIKDSLADIKFQIADSIFKCQHTYQ